MPAEQDIVLSVENLRVNFPTLDGVTQAVRGVSFQLVRGKTLAIVGESGSGKSVTSYSILRLIQKPGQILADRIMFYPRDGKPIDIARLHDKSDELYRIRGGKISMIFQEPMTALSPVHTVGNQICEAILLHQNKTPRQAEELAAEMLAMVGIPDPRRRLQQYPFEFSGGMRQRVVIAMALVCRPEILIADEPTTALDVTIQAQILKLIKQLQAELGTSVIFITHDLGVVAQVADDVVVMCQGRIVETAPVRDLYRQPYHPYTRRLMSSIPHAARDPRLKELGRTLAVVDGLPPGYSLQRPRGLRHGASPILYRLPGGRQVLVWPAAQEAVA
ncbi:MAG TPA: ABC transporter ATP-binding protein [Tepidisphaeraceae bacterium]|nr:ABC transporter ATP-binding protein [Tepidisphaeraceae bacterium]